jgi:hypothetical protein
MRINAATAEGWLLLAAGGAALAALAWIIIRGPSQAARDAVGIVGDVAGGAVKGVGDIFGLPDPAEPDSRTKCCRAASGQGYTSEIERAFDVSLHCPAGDYLRWAAFGTRPEGCA